MTDRVTADEVCVELHDSDWSRSLKPKHKTAVIIGSAPSPRVDLIPQLEPCLKIACNAGVHLYDSDIWMVFDASFTQKPPFEPAYKTYKGIKLFGRNLADLSDMVFEYEPTLKTYDGKPVYPLLRGGATIAGCALQLCYHLKIKRVYFVGVDMYGQHYADGSIDLEPRKEREWAQLKRMNLLINNVTDRMTVYKTSGYIECREYFGR